MLARDARNKKITNLKWAPVAQPVPQKHLKRIQYKAWAQNDTFEMQKVAAAAQLQKVFSHHSKGLPGLSFWRLNCAVYFAVQKSSKFRRPQYMVSLKLAVPSAVYSRLSLCVSSDQHYFWKKPLKTVKNQLTSLFAFLLWCGSSVLRHCFSFSFIKIYFLKSNLTLF